MFVFKNVRNVFCAKFANFNLKLLFNKIFEIFTLTVFIDQSIILLIGYLKYETLIDLKLNRPDTSYRYPAITFCIDFQNIFHLERRENTTIRHYFGNLTRKYFVPSLRNNCKTFTNILESFTTLGSQCITLFSALIERKFFFD
jgi:hypothetical protein